MDLVYEYNHWYPRQEGRQYLIQGLEVGFPSGSFGQTIRRSCNALLNSKGGMIVFGVEKKTGRMVGVREKIDRVLEDMYRLALDRELRNFTPSVSPDMYRINFIPLENSKLHIIEIKVSAGGQLFENYEQQVYVVKHGSVHGPLYPQEIKDLVLIKYKQEILMRASLGDGVDDTFAGEQTLCPEK